MSHSRDKQYAQIARACLQVLNNVNPAADRSAQIQELYDAIDAAMGDIYKHQQQALDQCYSTLQTIASMDPQQHNLEQAIELAAQQLPARH
ncbi:hypothetical protein [Motiliproteus sp.]|uniref:hypothetical protein n=1 Tax=Motiliproteus sp. TaxID=1898955 RepID=UPI003BAA8F50